jgi:hypothetical protein
VSLSLPIGMKGEDLVSVRCVDKTMLTHMGLFHCLLKQIEIFLPNTHIKDARDFAVQTDRFVGRQISAIYDECPAEKMSLRIQRSG